MFYPQITQISQRICSSILRNLRNLRIMKTLFP